MKDKSIALMSFLAMLFMITVLFIFIAFGGAKMAKCDKWIITIIMGVICVVIVLTVVLAIICIWRSEKECTVEIEGSLENTRYTIKQQTKKKIVQSVSLKVVKKLKQNNYFDSLAESIANEIIQELEIDAYRPKDNYNEEAPQQ
ncbi:MAG: hypothetical protein IJU92_08050 [Spirochaetaceae bacterium]|nr:hypothetical protein [Spirochaetaceae bacterium]